MTPPSIILPHDKLVPPLFLPKSEEKQSNLEDFKKEITHFFSKRRKSSINIQFQYKAQIFFFI